MPAVIHTMAAVSEAERNSRIYAGDIIIFRNFPMVAEFVDVLRERCVRYLGHDPERVHERVPISTIEQAAEELRRTVRRDTAIAKAWGAALAEVGVDIEVSYGDGVIVRGQTPAEHSQHERLTPLAAHRDTWGSTVAAQTNWWAPLFATTPERTLALFPTYFERAIANNSAGWDYEKYLHEKKSDRAAPTYPRLPTATETPSWRDALPISLVPGDLMCFSGAHLHASVPNTTNRTRLSFESRTANGTDVAAGRGAPNVDGDAVRGIRRMFKHLKTNRRLD